MHIRDTMRRVRHSLPIPWSPPRGVRRLLGLYDETQWWPPERIEAYQLERLRAILTHAEENVPYYRELFRTLGFRASDVSSLSELRRLPLLEKESVRESGEQLTAREAQQWRPVTRCTGGSTGRRLEVLMGESAQHAHLAQKLRHQAWAGWRPGMRLARFELFDGPDPGAPSYLDRSRRLLDFNAVHFTRESLAEISGKLAQFRPGAILAFPSHLYWLCQYLADEPCPAVRPGVLLTGCEMLYGFQRQEIERHFGVPIHDFYGMSEHATSAGQCPAGAYHLGAEEAYTEVLRPDGTPAQPGETGEIVGTHLENYAMPLIRYRTGDLATVGTGPCRCGRGLPVLQEVIGRTQDVVATPEGVVIFPHRLFSFDRIPGVKELQIVQEEVHRFRVLVEAAPGFGGPERASLAMMLQKGLGYPIDVETEVVPAIPRTLRGKYRLVVCRVPSALWTGDVHDEGK